MHIASGVSALLCAAYLGSCEAYPSVSIQPHSVVLSVTGVFAVGRLVRVQRGQRSERGSVSVKPFHRYAFRDRRRRSGMDVHGMDHGGQTERTGRGFRGCRRACGDHAASGFVKPMPAVLIGVAAGMICYLMVSKVKKVFGYDDSLDAFGVHGVGGTLGAILTGVFATKEVNDLRMGKAMGLVDGDAGQVVNQLIAVLISWGLAIVGTLVILKICNAAFGVRLNKEDENAGLDLSMHGEEGYNFEA